MFHEFTAVIVKDGEWYCGHLIEVPGAVSQAKSLEELHENLREAAHLILETMRERALAEAAEQQAKIERISVSA